MVIFKDAFIVVHDREVGRGVDEELIGHARMIHVMNSRRENSTHGFQFFKRQEMITSNQFLGYTHYINIPGFHTTTVYAVYRQF